MSVQLFLYCETWCTGYCLVHNRPLGEKYVLLQHVFQMCLLFIMYVCVHELNTDLQSVSAVCVYIYCRCTLIIIEPLKTSAMRFSCCVCWNTSTSYNETDSQSGRGLVYSSSAFQGCPLTSSLMVLMNLVVCSMSSLERQSFLQAYELKAKAYELNLFTNINNLRDQHFIASISSLGTSHPSCVIQSENEQLKYLQYM